MDSGDFVLKSTPLAGGDLSGTIQAPIVTKVNGIAISGTPSAGKIIIASSPTDASWQTAPTSGFANPMTANGDLIYGGASGAATRLAPGTSAQILIGGATPAWGQVSLTAMVSGILPVANGGTGVSTSTGTGAVVRSTSPALITPDLGTPSAIILTNGTALPLTTAVTGILPIANGGTGSNSQNFVDLTNPQNVAGIKTFTSNIYNSLIKPTMQMIATGNSQYDNSAIKQYFSAASFGNNAGVLTGVVQTDVGATATKWTIDKLNNAGTFQNSLMFIEINTAATTFNTSVSAGVHNGFALGKPGTYWSNSYSTVANFNSTASLSGSTAGKIIVTGSLNIPTGATNGYVIGGNAAGDLAWVNPATLSPLTTKGDIHTYSTVNARLGVGADGYALVADSTQATGLRWALVAGSGDMLVSTYDPASIAQQMLGTTATQNISGKSFTDKVLLTSTATSGAQLFNTVDQVTNSELGSLAWASNILTLKTSKTGTGSGRAITIDAFDRLILGANALSHAITIDGNSTVTYFDFNRTSSFGGSNQSIVRIRGTGSGNNQSSLNIEGTFSGTGIQYGMRVLPTVNMSSTGAYTALLVNVTQTAVGTGQKNLLDLQVGGTSKARIDNLGHLIVGAATTAGSSLNMPSGTAPTTPVDGDIWFDGTNIKMQVSGTTKTFTLT